MRSCMSLKVSIKGPRQRRAIEALLNQESISVREMESLIGALNPCQVIFELRKQGFRDLIKTRRYSVLDRDGNRCLPGEYYISSENKSIIKEALKEYFPSTSAYEKGNGSCTQNNLTRRRV